MDAATSGLEQPRGHAVGREQVRPKHDLALAASSASRVMLRPYFFGAPDRRLFGLHGAPQQPANPPRGVVLCYPWGHEYANSQRVFRVLASGLVERGYHVLRFDYFGTGDSLGSADQIRVHGQVADVEQAVSEMRNGHGVEHVSLVGLRLGATLCAMAAERIDGVDRLVLWEPIVDGAEYVESLRTRHADYVHNTFPNGRPEITSQQVCGHHFADEFADDLSSIAKRAIAGHPARSILYLLEGDVDPEPWLCAELRKCCDTVALDKIDTGGFWGSEIGINLAAAPRDALDRVLAFMEATQ